jgi:DNA-3-methyladenine glycosylase
MLTNKNILDRSFYERDAISVAKDILGKLLVRKIGTILLSGKITEVEAYLPFIDAAAHSYVGRTKRNKSLFGEAGHIYIHKMHGWNLMDFVVEFENIPGSVLIRSMEPKEGIDTMMKLRNTENVNNLTNGPGKVCEALQISAEFDGVDITSPNSPIYIVDLKEEKNIQIAETPRIGISKAKELNLRFVISNKK